MCKFSSQTIPDWHREIQDRGDKDMDLEMVYRGVVESEDSLTH